MVVLKGSGENGKTHARGQRARGRRSDYAVALPDRVLLARSGDHPTELMTLRGARLAFMEEFPELGHLNVKRLKDLHGTGRITARFIGKDSVSWQVDTHDVRDDELPAPGRRVRSRHLAAAGAGGLSPPVPQGARAARDARRPAGRPGLARPAPPGRRTGSTRPCWPGWLRAR